MAMPLNCLGVAAIGGACNPQRSCGIVKHIGTPSGHVAAHELGHR